MQPRFSKWLILLAFFGLSNDGKQAQPDRTPRPERVAGVHYEALPLDAPDGSGTGVTGLWTVVGDDPRLAGLSGLGVLDAERLIAVSDSGVLVELPKPGAGTTARFRDLDGGPGYPTFKKYRDAEALLILRDSKAAPAGYLVTFENRHSLFAYDQNGVQRRGERLPPAGWSKNKGAEALVVEPGGARLMIGESGRNVIVQDGKGTRIVPLTGASGGVADAVRLADGRMIVAVREIGLTGLINRLAWLERDGGGYRLRNFATVPLGVADNIEGLAAETGPGGRTTLWAVTDNDGWRRTLLIRMNVKSAAPTRRSARRSRN